MNYKLTIMSGAGNIFSVLDGRDIDLPIVYFSEKAPEFCKAGKYKTEGLIVANNSENNYDFDIEFFNPDGSHGAMCGNGGRCAAKFALMKGFFSDKSRVNFRMAGNDYFADFLSDKISLFLPPPIEIKRNILIKVDDMELTGSYINVGSDHFVCEISNYQLVDEQTFRSLNLNDISRKIRFHQDFLPKGVNVNFYYINRNQEVQLRTYERGVEAQTGACGTGAVSTAISVISEGFLSAPVLLIPPSRIPLEVDLIGNFPGKIEKIILTGEAVVLDEIEVEI